MTNLKAGVSIYQNGVLRGAPTTSRGALYQSYNIVPVHGSAPQRLGTRDGGSFLIGALDEMAIYSRVLSAAEIMDHIRAPDRTEVTWGVGGYLADLRGTGVCPR